MKHGEKKSMKKAILLAGAGTGLPEAQPLYDGLAEQARQKFPDAACRLALTYPSVRRRLAQAGQTWDSPEMALARLQDEDFTHVAVLPLFLIAGQEFHHLYINVHVFGRMRQGFQRILVARPLLSSMADCERLATAILEGLPEARQPGDALLLMAHGVANHPAYASYYAMQAALQAQDSLAFLAASLGRPSLEDVLPALMAQGPRKVFLKPFMAGPGQATLKHLAGEESTSWKSILSQKGCQAELLPAGLLADPRIAAHWLDHLEAAYSHFR